MPSNTPTEDDNLGGLEYLTKHVLRRVLSKILPQTMIQGGLVVEYRHQLEIVAKRYERKIRKRDNRIAAMELRIKQLERAVAQKVIDSKKLIHFNHYKLRFGYL